MCDRLEIRFEGQRRIEIFEAILSASLLRKSIVDDASGHLRRLAHDHLFKSCAIAAISQKPMVIQYLRYFATQYFGDEKPSFMPFKRASA
jgi:hypothetical protein